MPSWRGSLDAPVPEGGLGYVDAPWGRVCLAEVEGEVHAFDDPCPHAACSLYEEGVLSGRTLECTCHGGAYDVVTGEPVADPAEEPLEKHAVQLVDGGVVLTTDRVTGTASGS
jgi:p-cumate 2,3-dioxygenase ferredoxin subunit